MELKSEFTFRSTDLPSRCFKFFADFKTQKKFCDVTFTVGGCRVSAHRVIVAAAIPFFQQTLEDDEIMLPDINPGVFEYLIDFAYTCELKINMENVKNLLAGAYQLGMDEVRDACCDFLAQNLNPDNVLVFREFATGLHYSQLTDIIDHYVKEHFVQISETEEFLSCSFAYMKELIAKDDIQGESEEIIFEAVLKWVRASPDDRKANLPDLLHVVRMPLMKPLYLTNIAEGEELICTSLVNRNLIDEAKNYNLFPQRRKNTCNFPVKPRQFMKADNLGLQNNSGCIYKLTAQSIYKVQRFDFTANEWFTERSRKYYTASGSAAELNDKMYFCRWGEILRYDPDVNECEYVAFPSLPRISPGSTSLKNRIYICGGRVGKQKASNVVECFDPEKGVLTKVSSMRTARWGLQAVTLGEYIYTVGGRDSSDVYACVERYPSVTGEWTTMPPMLTKRGCPGAAVLNGKIYACGGCTLSTGRKCCATAEVYDPIKKKWEFISPMNTTRCEFNLVACRGKLYALGGTDDTGAPLYTCEVYDPEYDRWTSGPLSDSGHFASGAVRFNRFCR